MGDGAAGGGLRRADRLGAEGEGRFAGGGEEARREGGVGQAGGFGRGRGLGRFGGWFGAWFGAGFGRVERAGFAGAGGGFAGGEHRLDRGEIEGGAIEEGEGFLPRVATEEGAEQGALALERVEQIRGQGEAVAAEEEVQRGGDVHDAAGDAEIFGAAAGALIGGGDGDAADGVQEGIEVAGEDELEEVIHIRDEAADGALGEAGRIAQFADGDAVAAMGDEDALAGFEEVGVAGAIPGRIGRAGPAIFHLVAEEARWDGGHGGGL